MIQYLTPIPPSRSGGLLSEVYANIRSVFPGPMPPPYLAHSPSPPLFAAYWAATRGVYLQGDLPRKYRDAIAAGVSQANRCPFCVEAHTEMVDVGDRKLSVSLLEGALPEDPIARALVRWSRATTDPDAAVVRTPEHDRAWHPQAIAIAVLFHYTNRVVNVFVKGGPLPLPEFLGIKRLAKVVLRPMMRRVVQARVETTARPPGDPPSLPPDMGWAYPDPTVAAACAAWVDAMNELRERTVPQDVATVVHERVQAWRGEPLPMDPRWIDGAAKPLNESLRPITQLALFVALASYRVDERLVTAAKAALADDRTLLELVGWSAFTAARRVGSWL